MSKKPPNRPGITFEVGARIEAQDYLQKWYPSRIEKIDYDEGKMLVHFDRWSHRYDEWILWDSNRLRPLERPPLHKEGLKEEEERLGEMRASRLRELPGSTESTEDQKDLPQQRQELRDGEEVLARWTDCRYYPAKIESINKEGTYTVQFYDGVIRCVKRIHIKSMPEDAKGQQDWIALVKAASAAAKNKGGNRPRTSANSNKDREDRREQQSDEELDDEEDDDDSQSEKLAELDSEEEDSKPASEELEPATAKRRSKRQGNLCSSKRTRLNKGAGCADSESECKAESKELPVTSQQKVSGAETSPDDERSQSVSCQKTPAPPSSSSLCKSRSRRVKHDSGESTTSNQNTTAVPEPSPSPSSAHTPPDSTHTAPTNSPQKRRRSQRLATSSDQSYPSSPHMRDSSTHPPPDDSQKAGEDSSTAVKTEAPSQKPASGSPSTAPPTIIAESPVTEKDKMTEVLSSNQTTLEGNSASVVTAPGQKVPSRTPKANKHAREPIINTKKSDDPTAPNESLIDLDHNKFKCKVPGCSKAFRKAKLLDYHLKYYHNTEKEMDSEICSPERVGRSRATSASMPTSTLSDMPDNKRRRTVSTSSSLSSQGFMLQMDSSGCVRPPKFCKKKRSSASVSSDSTEISLPPPTFDHLHDKIIKKDKHLDGLCIKTERKFKLEDKCQLFVKKRDKDRRKEKDLFRIKQKKKKKKKKKSKLHCYADLDEMSLAYLDRLSSPLHRSSSSAFKHSTFQYPRAILSVDLSGENLSDIDFLEDSTTESLLFSGDEYNQDLDSITMEDFQYEDDDGGDEIVRCICEMDEENGFMIQCEDCMCWQHSVCMGLLEDSIPDHYICYICRDPPGQRWSAKYRHDKEWLQKGHMYGLSFLTENYSHQNAKKIVSTHQLLADVYSVKNLLHGLQLKMDILQNKHNPSLHLWARSWVNSDEDQPMGGVPDCLHFKEHLNLNSSPETYITSEHSYQKPPGTGLEHTRDEQGMQTATQFYRKEEEVSNAIALTGCVNDSSLGSKEQARNCLQWQMNLLTHIEDVQNQLSGRMDLIEKELDVLESWLDFTGELEPPDPLARLPQVKCRIKQLLTDLGKVQQMSTLCSV
ncbi:PHD finger protein 20-like protein 1 isoform X1 [Carassius auratus]|uniref:PHD finger protein 20-like protein 1 n=1 Tax=Carassius auratus TaxID=7957 RepID=A0A6P6PHM4_CARAU|nr:PHD finger protein 20-like protein 1 isoform X1 [Carassius auratus]XP_026120233.1 PHD finger protein 20-like protein 1 isoform X1 [Carassius auratus]